MPPSPPVDDRGCTLFRCFCCWRRVCSPRIPRVGPGRDYVCIPAGADDRPAWSLLVGFLADTGLRLHRFRVTPSGRILGRSNDALENFHRIDNCPSPIWGANATLSPDGRSLCLLCRERLVDAESTVVPTRALKLELDDEKRTISQLPTMLLERIMPCRPVTAAGDIWAHYFHMRPRSTSRLVMQRLDMNNGRWVEVGSIEFPYELEAVPMKWGGSIFQGYAVPPWYTTRSWCLYGQHTTSSASIAPPAPGPPSPPTLKTSLLLAATTPLLATLQEAANATLMSLFVAARGVYVEEDDAIYFLQNTTIFAYKLHRGDYGRLELKPPTTIDSLCPFHEDGYAYLTHLGGRVMCSVWIGVVRYCSCENFHVLISTFRVRRCSDEIPNGIEVLHATCRRLDMLPSRPGGRIHEFCFLQEYDDKNSSMEPPSSMLSEGIEDLTSSCAQDSTNMLLHCCREFFAEPRVTRIYVLKEPCIQVNKALYIACCQADSGSLIVYRTNVVNGRLTCHDNPLVPHRHTNMDMAAVADSPCHGIMEEQPAAWYFVRSGSSIHAVPYAHGDIHQFSLERRSSSPSLLRNSRPAGVRFAMVLRVGQQTIALTHTLEVFCYAPCASKWTHRRTGAEPALLSNNCRKVVNLSGYAALSADSFIVSEDGKCRCYLLDLRVKTWRVVHMPHAAAASTMMMMTARLRGDDDDDEVRASAVYGPRGQVLHGRCVFVDGFIYSCGREGLVAHEIILEGGSLCLGGAIYLRFKWRKIWEGETMCLDYVGKDAASGTIVFCVVQGVFWSSPHGQDVYVTTVQVETERVLMSTGKMKPVEIHHVDIATCFVEGEQGRVHTSACFALGS